MQRITLGTLVGSLAVVLWAALPKTTQADETSGVNHVRRGGGSLTSGINQAGTSITTRAGQSTKTPVTTTPTPDGNTGQPNNPNGQNNQSTPGTTDPKQDKGNSLFHLGHRIGHHGGHHQNRADKDHGRRPWDHHDKHHGGSMIGSLHHHHHHFPDLFHHANFAHHDHQGMGGSKNSGTGTSSMVGSKNSGTGMLAMGSPKHTGTGNSTGSMQGNKGTQSNKGSTNLTGHTGTQMHHAQHPPVVHAAPHNATTHAGKTGKK